MTEASTQRLGRTLVRAGLISQEQLKAALDQADGRTLPRVLEDLGYASENSVATTVAEQFGVALIDIGNYELDPNASMLISTDLMRRYRALPVQIDGDVLVVAMSDPANILAVDDLRIVTGRDVRIVVAVESELLQAIERFTHQPNQRRATCSATSRTSSRAPTTAEEEEQGEESAVARLMNQIVTDAIRQGAGDIYIEPQEHELRVRYRIDGVCQTVLTTPKKTHRQLISRLKIMSAMDIAERRVPQDGRFGVTLDGSGGGLPRCDAARSSTANSPSCDC